MANNWKKKLDEAEVTPNPRVWDRIAAEMNAGAPASGSSFPSYLAWAAAVAVFALSGMLIWYASGFDQTSELAFKENEAAKSALILEQNDSQKNKLHQPLSEVKMVESSTVTQFTSTSLLAQQQTKKAPSVASDPISPDANEQVALIPETETEVSTNLSAIASNEIETVTMPVNEQEADVVNTKTQPSTVAKFEYPEAEDFLMEKKKKSKSSDKRLWVGVAQGVGSYSSQLAAAGGGDAGVISPFSTDRTMEALQTKQQTMNEQMTLSTGVFVGVPLANKLAVVTGLSYNKSNFASEANTLNGELLHFTADLIDVTDLGKIEEVSLNGTYEMAIMPVLADYTIASGAFDWSLQAGPEVGFLLRQQISNDQLNINRTTRPGDLYRPFHLRVALGTTVSYEVNSNFEVSFQPIVEQAVTSITNASASFDSYPLNYSALVGFRYTFN